MTKPTKKTSRESSGQMPDTPTPLTYTTPIKVTATNVLLIDQSVEDAQVFSQSTNTATYPIGYSTTSTKADLTALLAQFNTIDRLALVFVNGLGTRLFLDLTPFFADETAQWLKKVIKEHGIKHIDFLGCDTLKSAKWRALYDDLAKDTGVIVGASNDRTGNLRQGGDWVLESTMENIEQVYFTSSITYYRYLLDTIPIWTTTGPWPEGIVIHDGYMYVANDDDDTISKISITNPSGDRVDVWANTAADQIPIGLATDGTYLYNANLVDSTIGRILFTDPSGTNDQSWATLGADTAPYGILIIGSTMYVAEQDNNSIATIDMGDPSIVNDSWAECGGNPQYITTDGTYLYVALFGNNSIERISLTTPDTDNIVDWAITGGPSTGITLYNGYIYVANFFDGSIWKYNINNPSSVVTNWAYTGDQPNALIVDGHYMYSGNSGNDNISRYDLTYVPPLSNTCFVAGTPITIDQSRPIGVPIERIVAGQHTIRGNPIRAITHTVIQDEHLIRFLPNSLGMGKPTKSVTVSGEHKILYNGRMLEARTFVSWVTGIQLIPYKGEVLYNIVLDEPSWVDVCGLRCETLNPDNIVAKLFTATEPIEKVNNYIRKLNKATRRNKSQIGLFMKSLPTNSLRR